MRSINLQMDGNKICATWDNFDCLATSPPAGFGDTICEAVGGLMSNTSAIEINAIVTSIENAPQNAKELAATVPAVAAANTQSKPCYINHGDLKLNNPTWDYCPKCRLLLDCSAR